MKKITLAVIAIIAVQVGTITVGAQASHAEAPVVGHVQSLTRTWHCTKDTVNGGQLCGTLLLRYPSKQWTEAMALEHTLPMSSKHCTKVTYLGWSTTNLGDGMTLIVRKSAVKANRYHLYRVVGH